MKTIITLVLFLFINMMSAQQTYNMDELKKQPKTEEQLIGKSIATSDVAIYKDIKYKVYKSITDKIFFVCKSKNGNYYRKYITPEQFNYIPNKD